MTKEFLKKLILISVEGNKVDVSSNSSFHFHHKVTYYSTHFQFEFHSLIYYTDEIITRPKLICVFDKVTEDRLRTEEKACNKSCILLIVALLISSSVFCGSYELVKELIPLL